MQRFRDHFRAHSGAFVLIGGAACDAWMTANALTFRRTKDLDIVLVADAVDAVFADRFTAFVEEGGYEVRQRQGTGKREFFRFYKPKGDDYPFMLELFSRAPAGLDVWPGQQVVPVPVEESVACLSAILMDESYYGLVLQTRYVDDGIPMVAVAGLIPLKAKAWLDLQARMDPHRATGDHQDPRQSWACLESTPSSRARAGPATGVRPGPVRGLAARADGTGLFAAGKRGDASVRLPIALTPSIRTDSVVTAFMPT